MRKKNNTKALLLLLITAFLSLQWSFTHIHLGQHHNHGDGQHSHSASIHTHQPVSHHQDVIDVGQADVLPHTDETPVLELAPDCTCSQVNLVSKLAFAVFSLDGQPLTRLQAGYIISAYVPDFPHRYLDRHPPGQRGPPLFT